MTSRPALPAWSRSRSSLRPLALSLGLAATAGCSGSAVVGLSDASSGATSGQGASSTPGRDASSTRGRDASSGPTTDAATDTTGTTRQDSSPGGCAAGQASCSGKCTTTASDHDNCGACGHGCTGAEVCSHGQCVTSCSSPTVLCAGGCVDTSTDSNNCGGCGNACKSGQRCAGGQCSTQCADPTVLCGTACVDTSTDSNNCGNCGHACKSGESCAGGKCAKGGCGSGLTSCSTASGGTACTSTDTDPDNCGTCGTACATSQQCVGGACGYASCADVAAATKASGGTPADGNYPIVVSDGTTTVTTTLYCHDMSGTPTEYLTLPSQTNANYSNDDDLVVTQFGKVHLELSPLEIDPGDLAFATTAIHNGGDGNSGSEIEAIYYATAYCCQRSQGCGTASVDLTGTVFAVETTGVFAVGGNSAAGNAAYSNNDQTVSLTGGGNCGWEAPTGAYNPFEASGDGQAPPAFAIYIQP